MEPPTPHEHEPDAASGSISGQLQRFFRLITIALGLTFLVSAITAVLALGLLQPRVTRYSEGAQILRNVHGAMLNQEAGLWGYLHTRNARYLQPYRQGRRDMDELSPLLLEYLVTDRSVSEQVMDMQLAQRAWVREWADPAVEGADAQEAHDEFFFAQGTALFGSYQAHADTLARTIDNRISSTVAQQRFVLASGFGIAILICIVMLAIASRRRNQLRQAIVAPVDRVIETMRRIREGDLTARAERDGPRELRQIALGLSNLTEHIRTEKLRREHQQHKLRQVLEIARELASMVEPDGVLCSVREKAGTVVGHDDVQLWLLEEARHCLTLEGVSPEGGAPATLALGKGLAGRAAHLGRTTWRCATDTHPPDCESCDRARLATPMVAGGRTLGVIEFGSPTEHAEITLSLLETLASHAATTLEAARLYEETRELSQRDSLTRLYNRRRLEEDLAKQASASQRHNRPLAFVMVDIDRFKSYNDACGHQQGDTALREFATTLAEGVRAGDTVYRYGGEELALLLPDTTVEAAERLAERLRARLARRFASPPATRSLTASFGVAGMPEHADTIVDLVAAADGALYEAKESGRDRVRVSGNNAERRAEDALLTASAEHHPAPVSS